MNYEILVNKEHPLPDDFIKTMTLVTTQDCDKEPIQIEQTTFVQFQKMQTHLKQRGIDIVLDSAYRSLEKQEAIYQEFIEKYGKDYADQIVAPVGTSEHHTGLAIDVNLYIDGKLPQTNKELMAHESLFHPIHDCLADFGFILRYPKGKEAITGYPYEPWHFRYVGVELAKKLNQQESTLEEWKGEYNEEHFSNRSSRKHRV